MNDNKYNFTEIFNELKIETLYSNIELNFYQKIPYLFMQSSNKCILNYSTGTGKTLTSLYIISDFLEYVHNFNINKNVYIYGNFTTKNSMIADLNNNLFNPTKIPNKFLNKINIKGYRSLFSSIFLGDAMYMDKSSEAIAKLIESNKITINLKFIKELSNSYVIVDEVQNLYSSAGFNSFGLAMELINQYSEEYNIKIIYISATFLTSSNKEIVCIANLVRDKKQPYIIEDYITNVYGEDILDYNKINELIEIVSKYLLIYTSDFDPKFYPTLNQIGNYIIDDSFKYKDDIIEYNNLQKIILYPLKTTGLQKKLFYDEEQLFSYNIVVPKDIQIYSDNENNLYIQNEILDKDKIGSYSCLFEYIINFYYEKRAKKEKIVIYHEIIKNLGIVALGHFLEYNGLVLYGNAITNKSICWKCGRRLLECHEDPTCNFTPCTFAYIIGSQTEEQKMEIVDKYKAPNNLEGNIISLLLISEASYAGINIPHTNHLLITSNVSNVATWIQIIGRVNRYGSHLLLPKSKQFVNIYTLIVVNDNDQKDNLINNYIIKYKNYQQIKILEKKLSNENTLLINFGLNNKVNYLLNKEIDNNIIYGKIVLENYILIHVYKYVMYILSIHNTSNISDIIQNIQWSKIYEHVLPQSIKLIYNDEEYEILIKLINTVCSQIIYNNKVRFELYDKSITKNDILKFNSFSNEKRPMTIVDINKIKFVSYNYDMSTLYNVFTYLLKKQETDDISRNLNLLDTENIKKMLIKYNAAYYDDDETSPKYFFENRKDYLEEPNYNDVTGFYFIDKIYKFNGDIIKVTPKTIESKTINLINGYWLLIRTGTNSKYTWNLQILIRKCYQEDEEDILDKRKITNGRMCLSINKKELFTLFKILGDTQSLSCLQLFKKFVVTQYNEFDSKKPKRIITTPFEIF